MYYVFWTCILLQHSIKSWVVSTHGQVKYRHCVNVNQQLALFIFDPTMGWNNKFVVFRHTMVIPCYFTRKCVKNTQVKTIATSGSPELELDIKMKKVHFSLSKCHKDVILYCYYLSTGSVRSNPKSNIWTFSSLILQNWWSSFFQVV